MVWNRAPKRRPDGYEISHCACLVTISLPSDPLLFPDGLLPSLLTFKGRQDSISDLAITTAISGEIE